MPRLGPILVAAIAVWIGCSKKSEGQSFEAAMRALCDAPDRCCLGETDPNEKAAQMAKWIADNVTHRDVVEMFRTLNAIAGMENKLAIVRGEVTRAGIDPARCALLNGWSTGPSL